jgi:hypothetical protein
VSTTTSEPATESPPEPATDTLPDFPPIETPAEIEPLRRDGDVLVERLADLRREIAEKHAEVAAIPARLDELAEQEASDDALMTVAARREVLKARLGALGKKVPPVEAAVREVASHIAKLEAQAIEANAKACASVLAELDRLRAEEVERHERVLAALDERIGHVRWEEVDRRGLGPFGAAQTKTIEDLTAPARASGFSIGVQANELLERAGLGGEDWAGRLRSEAIDARLRETLGLHAKSASRSQ